MVARSYYEVLEVAPTATPEEIRRAFRRGIARYHPDKVQQLGSEIQDIAAERAAECTRAYRTLSDPIARAEYDAQVSLATEIRPGNWGFEEDRARAMELVGEAALARVRDVVEHVIGPCEAPAASSGFDIACTPPPGMWRSGDPLRVLGRLVTEIDEAAVEDGWVRAMRLGRDDPREACVFLMGPTIAPSLVLGKAVEGLRRRKTGVRGKLTLVLINITTWSAQVPADASTTVQLLLRRLQFA